MAMDLTLGHVSLMLISKLTAQTKPLDAIALLLKECVDNVGASRGRVFLLDYSSSAFHTCTQVNRDDEITISLSRLNELRDRTPDTSRNRASIIEEVVLSRSEKIIPDIAAEPRSRHHDASSSSRILVPFLRGNTCLGLIDLESDSPNQFTSQHLEILRVASGFATLLFEKRIALRHLRALQQPVNYKQPFETFIDDLILTAVDAIGMPYLVLREFRDDRLYCLGFYGLQGEEKSQYDIVDLERYPSFLKAVSTCETVIESDVGEVESWPRTNHPDMDMVRSFIVAPILTDQDQVFGTLSAALECKYDYSQLETQGLETLANSIGVAIANYRMFHRSEGTLFNIAQAGAAITALEVAQAVRHESLNYLNAALKAGASIRLLCNSPSRPDKSKVNEQCDIVARATHNVLLSIDKIKQITRPPKRHASIVDLKQLWEQAFGVVVGRLDELRVSHRIEGAKTEIEGYPDYLVQLFLNLLLNSLDAFKLLKRRQSREIRVYINQIPDADETMKIRYVDNAGGINVAQLPTRENGKLGRPADIFEPSVTTKGDEGSGYGLYLARRILAEHKGSIDLVDYHAGVTFEITLKTHLPADHSVNVSNSENLDG